MTAAEVTAIETAARKKGATPNSIMAELEKGREKKGLPPLSESAVRRVPRGEAYQRTMLERRGRPRKATKRVIKALEKSRAKVSKKRKGKRVTYKMIMTAAGIKGKVSVRRLQPVLKETEGVSYKKDRERPERTTDDVEKRNSQAVKTKKDQVGNEEHVGGRRPGRAARDPGQPVRREDGAGDRGATVKAPIFFFEGGVKAIVSPTPE